MIIKHFTDNDLYKFSTMYAIQKLYPNSYVKYEFFNRGIDDFPQGFASLLQKEVNEMGNLTITNEESEFIKNKCYFFDPVFIDFLKGFKYDPKEVYINQIGGKLEVIISGYWYRTVLWEVPLMALISELYFNMKNIQPNDYIKKTQYKAFELNDINADYSEFGTRRRFSFHIQDKVVEVLKANSTNNFKGTSNVYLAMKHNTTPIGTMPHEWFMFHGALYGYRASNMKSLESWVDVYQGSLGITLTDTYTSDVFFDSFNLKQAKLFDGVRHDSGDPISYTDRVIDFYIKNRIDPKTKTIVYSDGLNIDEIKRIKNHVGNRIHDAYGIGTYFTNDVGAKPLNMVIKLTDASLYEDYKLLKTVKLSDVLGKNTGDKTEVDICKLSLKL